MDSILKTKLFIPSLHPGLVERDRLLERLDEGVAKGLTLVSAPAGFGKTTLLSAWAVRRHLPAAWLSLDTADNEPLRFLTYLVTAINRLRLNNGEPALAEAWALLTAAPPASPPAILSAVINQLTEPASAMMLILDDFQVITDRQVIEAVVFLIEHRPPGLHLVIATRVDPPLPLSRLRARGQLLEIRAADLRFLPSETIDYLDKNLPLKLAPEEISTLATRTEGWAAGLQMAVLSLGNRTDTAQAIRNLAETNRFILEYLADEVLTAQPEEIQQFLLKTSILDRFSAPLCEAMLTDEDSTSRSGLDAQTMLEMVEKCNLFLVPLDGQGSWFRYHHLFADLLRVTLRRRYPENRSGMVRELYHRASRWCEANGWIEDAIHYALAGKDDERVAQIIETRGQMALNHDDLANRLSWTHAIPADLYQNHPWLCLTRAWALVITGQLADVPRLLDIADQALAQKTEAELSPEERLDLQGNLAATRAYLAFFQGDLIGTIAQAKLAREWLAPTNQALHGRIALQLGESYITLGQLPEAERVLQESIDRCLATGDLSTATVAVYRLALVDKIFGRLRAAEVRYRTHLQRLAGQANQSPALAGMVEIGLADIYREWNQLEKASRLMEQGMEHVRQLGKPHEVVSACGTLLRLRLAEGNLPEAARALQEAEALAARYTTPLAIRSTIEAYKVRLLIALGDRSAAEQWAASQPTRLPGAGTYGSELTQIAQLRILLTLQVPQQADTQALVLAQTLSQSAETAGRVGRLIEIQVLWALACSQLAQEEQALNLLHQALELAQAEDYIRVFFDEGLPLQRLLMTLSHQILDPVLTRYIQILLDADQPRLETTTRDGAAFHPAEPEVQPGGRPIPLVEPLTDREIEVLQLISLGLSNQAIAQQISVTLSTVKKHTSNLFGKLGVTSRTQALLAARQAGYLPKA